MPFLGGAVQQLPTPGDGVVLSVFCVQSQYQIMYKTTLNTFVKEATSYEVFKYRKHSGGLQTIHKGYSVEKDSYSVSVVLSWQVQLLGEVCVVH